MIDSARVRDLMEARGMTQTALASRVGVTQGAIAKIVSTNPGGSAHLHKIARVLKTSAEYLTGETDDPAEGALPIPTESEVAEHLDLVPVQQVDLAYGLGASILDDHPDIDVMHFPRAWIESITAAPPAMLFFARGRGDSMSPSIQNDDIVIIDRSQRTIREPDLYWALTIGEMAMIKRVRVRGDVVTLLSDNATVPNDTAHPDEINVVGRVIFIGRRV